MGYLKDPNIIDQLLKELGPDMEPIIKILSVPGPVVALVESENTPRLRWILGSWRKTLTPDLWFKIEGTDLDEVTKIRRSPDQVRKVSIQTTQSGGIDSIEDLPEELRDAPPGTFKDILKTEK